MEKLINELKPLGLDEKVQEATLEICERIKIETKKGRERKMALFFSVYLAYHNLGMTVLYEKISGPIGLEKKYVSKALQSYSQQLNIKALVMIISYKDYISAICSKINMDSHSDQVSVILRIDKLEDKYDELLGIYSPEVIASAMVYYYLILIGIKVDKKDFIRIVGSNENTINGVVKHIEKIIRE